MRELWGNIKVFLGCSTIMFIITLMVLSIEDSRNYSFSFSWGVLWAITILGGLFMTVAYYENPERGREEREEKELDLLYREMYGDEDEPKGDKE